MSIPTRDKDPSAVLDYVFDFSPWLPSGDTISTATWTVPSGITKLSESNTTTTATVWLSGGTARTIYRIVCRFTTANGRTDERSIDINVTDR